MCARSGPDALLRRLLGDDTPIEQHVTGRWPQQASDEAHERRLAGTVRTNDGVPLAAPQREIEPLEHDEPAECHVQVAGLEDWRV